MAQRYNGRPSDFCLSYEEIRKHDIRDDGTDTECHKNDKDLKSATLTLDVANLRKVYTSIGLADKDGNFPVKALVDAANEIDNAGFPAKKSIRMQLELLARYRKDFAECQNSTMGMIQGISLGGENLKYNRCIVNRVYEKQDEGKRPVMYVFADLPDEGRVFFVADKGKRAFSELSQEEFENTFECYELDPYRPWEQEEPKEKPVDLTRSSGKVDANEREER